MTDINLQKDDPRVKYRQEVERRINRGKFSIPARRLLNSLCLTLKLDSEVAAAIEAEVQQLYLEYQRKLAEYEETLVEAIEAESTLSESTLKDLRDYQQHLGLRDEDVAPIEERLMGQQKAPSKVAQSPPELGDLGGKSVRPDSHTSFTEDLGNGVTLEMVAIPGGAFLMGSPESELERTWDEGPQHIVTLQPFFMGKFPVTQAQWQAVASLPKVNIDLAPDPSEFKGVNRPVEQVSWYEAVEFCARLSTATGREYRLPSEAEWEYACRAGTTTPFYFGETISTDLANYCGVDRTVEWTNTERLFRGSYGNGSLGIYRQQTTEVGSFPPNAFGLYDMHGNVGERCADRWHRNYDGAPTDGSAWLSEDELSRLMRVSSEDNSARLMRGGSWATNPEYCRSASRNNPKPDKLSNAIGFRVVGVRG